MNSSLTLVGGTPVITHSRYAALGVHHCKPYGFTFPDPIVFAAGLGFGGGVFKYLMSSLARLGHESHAVSFRGHPGSEEMSNIGTVEIADYVADYRYVIDKIGAQVITVGHSMGGLVAALAAHDNPLVAAHVSLASAPPRWVIPGPRSWTKIPAHAGEIFGSRPVSFSRDDVRELFFNGVSDELFEECFAQLCAESGTVIREIILMEHRMQRLQCPVLAVAAENDLITPFQKGLAKQLGVTRSNFKTLPSGHVGMLLPPFAEGLAEMIHQWILCGFDFATQFERAA